MNVPTLSVARLAWVLVVLTTLMPQALRAEERPRLYFEDDTRASGIVFHHQAGRSPRRLMPEQFGSGVLLADFDRNGAVDVVLINSGGIDRPRSDSASNALFLNNGGGVFRNASQNWRLTSPGYGMGAAAGDFDGDGWTDLFLTTYGSADVLLRNTGSGFVDVSQAAGIPRQAAWSTSAGFLDIDRDGDLDLWVVRYLDYEPESALPCTSRNVPVYCTPLLEPPLPDQLLLNNGDGTFSDVSSRISSSAGKGLALAVGDLDLDGDIDVYVANDTTSNQLWINDGGGRFTDQALIAGVGLSEYGRPLAGMGADMADTNGDGRIDLGSTNFQSETTAIYLQMAPLVFREVSDAIGVGESARARLSWGIDFFDADNDGDEDLLVANGHLYDNLAKFSTTVTTRQTNTLYRLDSGKFKDVTKDAGPALALPQVSRGLATGDLNGDGALDFVVNNNNDRAQVGLNRTKNAGNFVSLWLEGRGTNPSAIGARVEVSIGKTVLVRQVLGSSSYLSANDPRIHLGLGPETKTGSVKVLWPGGESQTIDSLEAGSHYRWVQGRAPIPYVPGEKVIRP